MAQVLHDERHGADGYSCPAQGTAPHPKDRALAEKIVAALDKATPAMPKVWFPEDVEDCGAAVHHSNCCAQGVE